MATYRQDTVRLFHAWGNPLLTGGEIRRRLTSLRRVNPPALRAELSRLCRTGVLGVHRTPGKHGIYWLKPPHFPAEEPDLVFTTHGEKVNVTEMMHELWTEGKSAVPFGPTEIGLKVVARVGGGRGLIVKESRKDNPELPDYHYYAYCVGPGLGGMIAYGVPNLEQGGPAYELPGMWGFVRAKQDKGVPSMEIYLIQHGFKQGVVPDLTDAMCSRHGNWREQVLDLAIKEALQRGVVSIKYALRKLPGRKGGKTALDVFCKVADANGLEVTKGSLDATARLWPKSHKITD